MAQITVPSKARAFSAMASNVDTPQQGSSSAQASPLAADTPMRRPVKLPGPAATAIRLISFAVSPAFFSMLSSSGISVTLWVRPMF